jgi:hypothetical protein
VQEEDAAYLEYNWAQIYLPLFLEVLQGRRQALEPL